MNENAFVLGMMLFKITQRMRTLLDKLYFLSSDVEKINILLKNRNTMVNIAFIECNPTCFIKNGLFHGPNVKLRN